MTEITRIVYEMGGRTVTRWSPTDSVHTTPNGHTVFDDLETGLQKVLNPHVPVAMTHGVDLPPDVDDDAEVLTEP